MDTVVIVLWIVGVIFLLISLISIIKRSIKTKRCTTPASAIITYALAYSLEYGFPLTL